MQEASTATFAFFDHDYTGDEMIDYHVLDGEDEEHEYVVEEEPVKKRETNKFRRPSSQPPRRPPSPARRPRRKKKAHPAPKQSPAPAAFPPSTATSEYVPDFLKEMLAQALLKNPKNYIEMLRQRQRTGQGRRVRENNHREFFDNFKCYFRPANDIFSAPYLVFFGFFHEILLFN